MKKLTLLFLSIVCVLCLAFSLTACGNSGQEATQGLKNDMKEYYIRHNAEIDKEIDLNLKELISELKSIVNNAAPTVMGGDNSITTLTYNELFDTIVQLEADLEVLNGSSDTDARLQKVYELKNYILASIQVANEATNRLAYNLLIVTPDNAERLMLYQMGEAIKNKDYKEIEDALTKLNAELTKEAPADFVARQREVGQLILDSIKDCELSPIYKPLEELAYRLLAGADKAQVAIDKGQLPTEAQTEKTEAIKEAMPAITGGLKKGETTNQTKVDMIDAIDKAAKVIKELDNKKIK